MELSNFPGESKHCIACNSSGHCSGCWSLVQSNHPSAGEEKEEEEEERRGGATGGQCGHGGGGGCGGHGDEGDQKVQQVEQGLGLLHESIFFSKCFNKYKIY